MRFFRQRKQKRKNIANERANLLEALTQYGWRVEVHEGVVVKHTGEPFYWVIAPDGSPAFAIGNWTSLEEATERMIDYFLETRADFTDPEVLTPEKYKKKQGGNL